MERRVLGITRPIRLTVVMTHPVQYYAPWFRHIASECPELDLTVLYATQPTPEQQGVGFGKAFAWDTSLTEGYNCHVVRRPRPDDNIHSDRFWGLNVPEIGEAIRETQPDVALIPGWYSVTLVRALRYCRRMGIPILYRGDTNLNNQPTGLRRIAWQMKTRLFLSQFDGFLSVGQRVDEHLRYFRVPRKRVFRSPHFVDNEFFQRSCGVLSQTGLTPPIGSEARRSFGIGTEEFVVLFVGKLETKKRPLDAIRSVGKLGAGVTLLLVGSGPLEDSCRALAERLNVNLVEAGFLNQTQLGQAYAAADCLVLPSDAGETWGLVVNEALATGLPCVVSDRVGCAPDLVTPGVTGEVFSFGDVNDLTAALQQIYDKSDSGHDWRPECMNRVASYSIQSATNGLVRACGALCTHSLNGETQKSERDSRRLSPAIRHNELPHTRVLTLCGHMSIVSGMERATFEVLRVLRERGTPVHCILNNWQDGRITELAKQVDATWSYGRYWETLDRHARNPWTLARIAWDIAATSGGLLRDALRFRPTHILVADFLAVVRNWPALLVLRALGARVILRLGIAPTKGRFYQRLWRSVVSPMVNVFVCNSTFTMNELLAYKVPASKVCCIYNVVTTRTTEQRPVEQRDPNKIIYVGQIIPPKGVHVLLDAVGLLVERGIDSRLDIIGDFGGYEAPEFAGYHEQLLQRSEQGDLTGRVRFLGHREDVLSQMQSAAVHCCPSLPEIREGFGLVNIEAKQAGLPSVVFPSGALPELISHRKDGWVAEGCTPDSLAEGLAYFLENPELRHQAACAARVSSAAYSRVEFSQSWFHVLEKAA